MKYSHKIHKWQIAFVMNCNLRCSYCFTNHGRFNGPVQVLERRQQDLLLDVIMETEGAVSLEFGTGETFLAYEEFINFIDRIKASRASYEGQDSLSVTTNGTLLNHKKIERLVDSGVTLVFSIDGNENVHLNQRTNGHGETYHGKVLSNYEFYLSCIEAKGIVQNTKVLSVVTKDNSLKDVEQFWSDKGGGLYSATLAWPTVLDEENLGDFIKLQNRYLADLEQLANEKAQKYDMLSFLDRFSGPMELFEGWRNRFLGRLQYCCAPLTGFFAVNSIGEIYPCELLMHKPEFLLGTLEKGINDELYEKVECKIRDFECNESQYLRPGVAVSTCFVELYSLLQTKQGRECGKFFSRVNDIVNKSYEKLSN